MAQQERSLTARLAAKAGPLPVWAWAALLLAGFWLYSRHSSSRAAPAPAAAADVTNTPPLPADANGGQPGTAGAGAAASNFSDQTLSALTGLQSSVDALTGAVQSSNAPPIAGLPADLSAYGPATFATPYYTDTTGVPAQTPQTSPAPAAPAPRISRPQASPAPSRYYTYQPGHAPAGRTGDAAPTAHPAGQTLHFTAGRGYYYA